MGKCCETRAVQFPEQLCKVAGTEVVLELRGLGARRETNKPHEMTPGTRGLRGPQIKAGTGNGTCMCFTNGSELENLVWLFGKGGCAGR